MSQEGKIVKVVVLQQRTVELKELKQGSLFKVITEGADGEGTMESDWQMALMDPVLDTDTGSVSFKSDTVTILMGTPKVVDITSHKENIAMKQAATSDAVMEVRTGTVQGATAQ